MSEIWKKIVDFNDVHFFNWRRTELIYLSNALAGEVGEFCNLVKHFYGGGTKRKSVSINDIAKESYDILVYLVQSLEILGVDFKHFEKIADVKLEENRRRLMKEKVLLRRYEP